MEKQSVAQMQAQRRQHQRDQEEQLRQAKFMQQNEYRNVLDGQKATRGLGLTPVVGAQAGQASPLAGNYGSRIMSGRQINSGY